MCLQWTIPIVVTHNFAQNAFLIYTGFSASNGGHFPVYSTTFLPFFERKFDAYLLQICLFDAYLRRSGGFMCQMTDAVVAMKWGPGGIFTGDGGPVPFRQPQGLQDTIPVSPDEVVQMTKDLCNYIYTTY